MTLAFPQGWTVTCKSNKQSFHTEVSVGQRFITATDSTLRQCLTSTSCFYMQAYTYVSSHMQAYTHVYQTWI